ncbi:hypothetical protein HY501_02405 [Candidatus Woesearchaeota archaeon]|nr:hypothetical protein [Candidatus Woesearchaeota archaeon]
MRFSKQLVSVALGAALLAGCPKKADETAFAYEKQANGMLIPQYVPPAKWDRSEPVGEDYLSLALIDRNGDRKNDLAVLEEKSKDGKLKLRLLFEDINNDGLTDLVYGDLGKITPESDGSLLSDGKYRLMADAELAADAIGGYSPAKKAEALRLEALSAKVFSILKATATE